MANRGQSWDAQVHSIADLREYGSQKLPKMYRDYYNEGAMDLVTYVVTVVEIAIKCSGIANIAARLRDNEAAFDRYKIKPRILVNVDNIDTSSELFGKAVGSFMRLSRSTC
jgi:(S)-2-hydroxy-acid oxidase